MQRVKFSVIIVCLNAGEKLHKTMESIQRQSCADYEILIKDGGSSDGSVTPWLERHDDSVSAPRIRTYVQRDRGIYDAMNQAVQLAEGEYFLFLNCGDYLYDEEVLRKVSEAIDKESAGTAVFYGNLYQRNLGTEVYSYREITPFTCYRNIPCHQTCFYHRSLFEERAYDLKYPVRADYEHFLYCYFSRKAKMVYLPTIISSYEGGGFSETKEHLRAAKAEHREITAKYLSRGQIRKYRLILCLTLQPLRTFAANNKALSGIYNKIKAVIYRK